MEKPRPAVRFQAEVNAAGKVNFSRAVSDLGVKPGTKVTVTIAGGVLSKQLEAIGVREEEVERIAEMQLEDREHVVSFLSSQGMLKKNTTLLQRLRRRRRK